MGGPTALSFPFSIQMALLQLFRMTEELVTAAKNGATVETFQKILAFLKDYVIYHFRDEEAYQASIGYSGLEAHREEHRQFTQTVLNYEKRLTENGFDVKIIKDLAGTVTAWLIYHVVDTDQKIVSSGKEAVGQTEFDKFVDLFSHSALDVMETMAGLHQDGVQMQVTDRDQPEGDIFVTIELVGDVKGQAIFGYSKELALNLLQSMTGMELTEMDELVQSALCELTNITCGNAASALVKRGLACDIKPPVVSQDVPKDVHGNAVHIDTDAGWLGVDVLM